MEKEFPRKWHGWYFEDDFLCTPEGDKYSELTLRAFFYWRQLNEYREVIFKRPKLDD